MAKKCMNCMSARPTPPHTNPMELGPKRFMIFDPKNGGVIFSTFLTPLPQKLQKVGFKWGGGVWGGVRTKNSLGDVFIWTKQ